MNEDSMRIGDGRKRAGVDTVRSILDTKGHNVWSIGPTATVFEALTVMADHEIGALPVLLSNRELVGIFSERDYSRKVILHGRSSKETPVEDVMTSSPVTVTLDHTVDECIRIMTGQRVRHLPVMDGGEVRGIISIGDLVKAIIAAQAHTIDQLHTYIGAGYPL